MGGGGSPPPAPDPVATAQAQAAANKETAITQYGLNATNQVTPEGTLSYKQIGTWPDGTPRFESTQTLSPEQQNLYNLYTKTQGNIGQIGVDQSARIGELLGKPVQMGNEATEARLAELGRARLDPQFAQQRDALENRLANQGVTPGSQAYNQAMTQFGQQQNDAYNQLYLTGRGQANQEMLTERNQPINEITALLSGSQVSQPNWLNAGQSQVAPTDYIGAVGQQQAALQNQYNQQQQQYRANMGGLYGIGAAGASGAAMAGAAAFF
jgi:hypothetical protein